MKKFFWSLSLFCLVSVHAQLDEIYIPPPDFIGTAVCTVNDYPYKYPIASLDETVFISFDDLEGDQKNYAYRIRRFDENWKPSDLLPVEFVEGYEKDYIFSEENSQATIQSYTHYRFQLPNENTRISKSGHYLVDILDENDEIVFNFPLVIYEKSVTVSVQIGRSNYPDKIFTHQAIRFWVHTGNMNLTDPSSDLTVRLLRNENIFESAEFHSPTFYSGNKLDYYDPDKLLFAGADEFLHFETRDLRGYNFGLDSMRLGDTYHAYVTPFVPGRFYNEQKDINGSFIVDSFQGENPDTEADYVRVHFRLPAGIVPQGRKMYVVGRFNQWQANEKSELKYRSETGFYETEYLLKQGYYDYYFVGKNSDGTLDWTAVWPSFSQTENRWTVLVYYHPPGARYTRIIGMGQGVSKPLK